MERRVVASLIAAVLLLVSVVGFGGSKLLHQNSSTGEGLKASRSVSSS